MALGKTIAAISTPSGKGGVAIIRISGGEAIEIADRVFFPRGKAKLKERPRMQIYGDVIYSGEHIDDGMATYFPAPNSYTGEDVVEISCHGGILVTRTVLEAVFSAGALPAEAGEFTRLAFINGKLSLTEAEAIGNLLEAKSREQIKITSAPARGRLAMRISEIRGDLIELLSSIFARIDYPDEDLGEFDDGESIARLEAIRAKIKALSDTYPMGRAISEGITTVICGKPNAGKSTVYNAILGEDAAIVTDIEGTTRDVLSSTAPLGKIILRISDTAGLRDKARADEVEKIGIDRTKSAIFSSELIIAVFDTSREASDDDRELISLISESDAAKIALLNKSDSERKFDTGIIDASFDRVIEASARDDESGLISALTECVDSLFTSERIDTSRDAIISSARQNAALVRAGEFVDAAISAFKSGVYSDAASSEIERALGAIAEIDGRAVSEEVVADIFSKFCVGK